MTTHGLPTTPQLAETPSERALLAEIAAIDAALSKQLTAILHHPEFRSLEASWRGLCHLVQHTPTGDLLKVRVLNASRKELADDLGHAAPDQSRLYARVCSDEVDMPGGEPYAVLVGDYQFSHRPEDVDLLRRIAEVAGDASCPFIASAAPGMFGLEAWDGLADVADLGRPFRSVEYTKWKAFRESDDSRYVALVVPRCLARRPYAQAAAGHDYAFQEVEQLTWMNPAYAYATVLAAAHARTGLCVEVRGAEGGGLIAGLPSHPERPGLDAKPATEVAIDERQEVELDRLGFIALCRARDTGDAVVHSARTVHQPKAYTGPKGPQATEDAAIVSRLPFLMTTARFLWYLKEIARGRVGLSAGKDDLERWLNGWLRRYVSADQPSRPLREAWVEVHPVPGRWGVFRMVAHLRPWLRSEELSAPVQLETVFYGS